MMKILLAAFVLLLIPASAAYGQVVETKGQNYDLVENFITGEANWVSHPERIMDGGWQNYALSNTAEKVIFNTNAVGSFVFDKDSCSYSIYENGFASPETQIIPSVSAVATYLNNGQWQNLPVNDEACTVTVDRYEDGVFLKSTKVITEDITEDVFISYTGTTENFYGNGTNSQFTLLQNSNGTNTGYFNGETITITGQVVEEFTQELRLDINSGFKETFKVTHDGNQELGISQTIHSGESITIGETVINIAELNGQSFDRQYLEDNQAQVFEIADQLNYDFDIGFQSLSNVNIIFDGDYKVNLDYADGGFVNYLEIDPTFGYTASSVETESSANCSTGQVSDATPYVGRNGGTACYRVQHYWDISSIPDNTVSIDNVNVRYDVTYLESGGATISWKSIEGNISTMTEAQRWSDTADGTLFLSGDTNTRTVANDYVVDLGINADSDLLSELSVDNEWGIGVYSENEGTYDLSRVQNAELEVTYTIPTTPQPPTGLTTVTGIPIELDWTAPVDNGGSAITGYKVYRTLNEFALTELPDNSANANGVDFSDNEFLLHGFESGTLADKSTNSITVTQTLSPTTLSDIPELLTEHGYVRSGGWTQSTGQLSAGYFAGADTNPIYIYDTSSIPDNAVITDIVFHKGTGGGTYGSAGSASCVAIDLSSRPTVNTNLWSDSQSGNSYATGTCTDLVVGDGGTVQLNSQANTDLQNNLSDDWFGWGVDHSMPYTSYVYAYSGYEATRDLVVTYEVALTASTTGVISTGVQSPNLSFTDSNLPDGTDDFSIGSWVKLDEGRDSTLDGTNNGATTGQTGKIGNAWKFDNDYTTTSATTDLVITGDATLVTWIKFDNPSNVASGYVAGINRGMSNNNVDNALFNLKATDTNPVDIKYWHESGAGTNNDYTFDTNSALNTWYHVALVKDSSAKTVDLYMDGTLFGTYTYPNNADTTDTLREFNLGKAGYAEYFRGQLDELSFWNKALTSSEISSLYNSGNGAQVNTSSSGLVVYYDFEQTGSLENQITLPPTNTKLLGLNDVMFSVGATTTSVDESVTTSSGVNWDSATAINVNISGNTVTATGSTAWDKIARSTQTFTPNDSPTLEFTSNASYYTMTGFAKGSIPSSNLYTSLDFAIYSMNGAIAIYENGSQVYVGGSHTSSTPLKVVMDSNGLVKYYSGSTLIYTSTQTASGSYEVRTTPLHAGATITADVTSTSNTNIISATGLTDNTSSPQHYSFTRSGNDFTIYQNGASVATATDSTSLGSNVQTNTGVKHDENTNFCCGNTMNNAQIQKIGMKIEAGHGLIGKEVNKIGFNLNNHQNPDGTFYARVYDSDQSTVLYEFGSISASSIASTSMHYFENTATSYTIEQDDYIVADLIGNTNTGTAPRVDIHYCGDNYGGCPVDIAQNIANYEMVGGTWSRSVSPAGSGDELLEFEIYGDESVIALYTTNIDGMIDEYFVNSDVLTSTEIDTIYERGVAPTLLTTVTATEHDDSTVVGGNNYYFTLKSTNAIGNSDFLTPFVSGLAGTPPNAPVISTAINNPNTTPLEITVSISPDAVVGSGTLTGFEIYRDGVLVDTVGLVSSVPNTVPSGGGTFEFSSKSISTHGTSVLSNLSSITTPSVPDAPSLTLSINNPNPNPLDITATFVAPSNSGGSAVTSYNLLHSTDDVTYTPVATNVTPDSTYTVSAAGLHYFKAQANNLIGSSLESAAVSINTPSVPDAPVTVSTSIGNPNANPLDIVVGFSASPNDQGSAITGYKVYRSIDDVTYTEITTLGNSVYSYADTVTVSGGYYYKVSSLNNVGEGLQSAYSLINTPTVPDAPVLTSGAVNSSQIDSTWTTPSNGNSEIISYEISVDGTVSNVGLVNADSQTGLTQNTAYEIKIRAINNVGTSAWSNAITSTTNTPPSGTNTISLNNSWGDVVIVDNTITVTGNPTPTLDKIEFILDTDIVSTVNNPSLTGTYAITLPDTVQHGLLVRVTASNGDTVYYDSNSITITGTTVYRVDAAEGGNTVAYTTARTPHPTNDALDQIELKWAKDTFPFDGSCTFMSPSQALEVRDLNNLPSSLSFTDQNGVNIYDTTVNISEKNNAYVYCWSGDDLQFGAQSEALGSNALLAGLSGLDSGLGTTTVDPVTGAETSYSILGAPMIVIFVLLIAGQATGRTAPTFIIIILAAVGILMGLGFFIIDEGIFGLILIMGAMGVMIGKKFL